MFMMQSLAYRLTSFLLGFLLLLSNGVQANALPSLPADYRKVSHPQVVTLHHESVLNAWPINRITQDELPAVYGLGVPLLMDFFEETEGGPMGYHALMPLELVTEVADTEYPQQFQNMLLFLHRASHHPLQFAVGSPLVAWRWLLGHALTTAKVIHQEPTAESITEAIFNAMNAQDFPNQGLSPWSWSYLLAYFVSMSLEEYEQQQVLQQ